MVTQGTFEPVRRLSGGNVQKVLLGREIKGEPNVIVTAYPVRGLDINSSYQIYDILNQQKMKGVGILFVGEDLDIMLELCDKIMVLCHSKVMGVVNANHTTKEELGLMMTGSLDLTEKDASKPYGIARDTQIDEATLEAVEAAKDVREAEAALAEAEEQVAAAREAAEAAREAAKAAAEAARSAENAKGGE